jgi:tRNA-dihydrouridine synthase B
MKIGNLEIKGKLFLAPMSNVTSLPFRLLCKKYGAAVVYSEMINADAFIRDSHLSAKRAYFLEEERPVGIQIFGSNKDVLVRTVRKIEMELRPDMIDINIGCPAYDVMKSGGGASLLKDEEKLSEIVKALADSTNIPLTCKIRITSSEERTIRIAKIIEASGAKALTVHGRTAKQKYSGTADWRIIQKIKEHLTIPVILNGDIRDEISAAKALETQCDALMIGRAAIGNPFLFRRINHFLETGKMLEKNTIGISIDEFTNLIKTCVKYDYTNISSIKMQAHNFIKGYPNIRTTREKISRAKNPEEIIEVLSALV